LRQIAQLSTTKSHDHKETAFHFLTSNIFFGRINSSLTGGELDDKDEEPSVNDELGSPIGDDIFQINYN